MDNLWDSVNEKTSSKFSVCLLIVLTAVKVIEEDTSEQLSPTKM